MLHFCGKSVYEAIAFGTISIFKREDSFVRRTHTDDCESEIERFRRAKEQSVLQLKETYQKALKEVGETNAQIFEIHAMMLEDEDYNQSVCSIIRTQKVNAEYAVAVTSDHFSSMFAEMDNGYMQARAIDVKDISNRILSNLSDRKIPEQTNKSVILCADDLTPSETVSLEKDTIKAFITAGGSLNSHTAILAKSMNIPAIIGVGKDFFSRICDGEEAIVDGFTGEIFISPDENTSTQLRKKQSKDAEQKKLLETFKGKETRTKDGTSVRLYANIGSVDQLGDVLLYDAEGIGLFRSEFLYLENNRYPSEEEQFSVYKTVLERMPGKKVIIRTLDIGADKTANYFHLKPEENPALGFRAIRICLTRPELFKTQLRALYRASVFGELGIMFPMIISTEEMRQILKICNEVREELKSEGLPYSEQTELGIMIETPAAAVISDRLAPLVDFFSVGTNDLTQYTLACDRQNREVEPFCDTHHEALLRLIEYAAENAHKYGKWIGICGELAADTSLTETFLKMNIDELSVSPSFVLKLRSVIRNTTLTPDIPHFG